MKRIGSLFAGGQKKNVNIWADCLGNELTGGTEAKPLLKLPTCRRARGEGGGAAALSIRGYPPDRHREHL